MANKKITELPILTTPSLSGVTVVVQDGVTYETSLQSLSSILSGETQPSLSLEAVQDSKDYTGFVTGSSIDVSYDWTNRQITLSYEGDINYYWCGIKHTLTSL